MNETGLQQKISEYFSKLPEQAKEVFSSMEWMNILKMIIKKYSLTQEQENLIGTETILVLLGIIHIDEYKNILNKEISLSQETKEKIIKEIDDTILKPIQGELIDAFKKNNIETNEAIDSIDWKQAILDIKTKYNFNLEQLEELERETKLIFAGSTNPENFKKEIQEKMRLTDEEASQITKEMNDKVFKKIRDAFAKIMEEKNSKIEKIENEVKVSETKEDMSVLKQAGIEVIDNQEIQKDFVNKEEKGENLYGLDRANMLNEVEHPELIQKTAPTIAMQKLSNSFNIPTTKTEYSLDNMTKEGDKKTTPTITPIQKSISQEKNLPKIDPYRMPIE